MCARFLIGAWTLVAHARDHLDVTAAALHGALKQDNARYVQEQAQVAATAADNHDTRGISRIVKRLSPNVHTPPPMVKNEDGSPAKSPAETRAH